MKIDGRIGNVLILLKCFAILHKTKFTRNMRITEIRIEGLFDMFDHTIPLNQDEHLTVVYGINGIGKTMIFRILDYFYDGKFEELVKLPFQKFVLTFENGDVLDGLKDDLLLFNYNGEEIEHENVGKTDTRRKKYFPLNYKDSVFKLVNEIPIYFISTERLHFTEVMQQKDGVTSKITSSTIEFCSEQMQQDIAIINNEYLKLSEQLGLSLSKRVLLNQIRRDLSYNELLAIKIEVENRIKTLQEVGLMRSDFEVGFELNENLSETDYILIAANLMDFQLKLTIFDDLHNKLKLFLEILNHRRLRYKTISISEENGFELINIKNQKIQLTQLSTGEQHAIIMFYELLFEVSENALVLIDEPENSLHIEWQMEYLKDIKDIIALRDFDVLVATHSPSIINGEWDLTVSLKGIEEEEYA
ncbi:MAG: ABC-type transport system involved in cytochrome c biogenesis ATPase subunit [Saprospiraceae bacterium]